MCVQKQMTALHLAALNGCLESLKLLVEAGADVHAVEEVRQVLISLLSLCVFSVLEILFLCILVPPATQSGSAPLHLAVERNHLECAKALHPFVKDVNAVSKV